MEIPKKVREQLDKLYSRFYIYERWTTCYS